MPRRAQGKEEWRGVRRGSEATKASMRRGLMQSSSTRATTEICTVDDSCLRPAFALTPDHLYVCNTSLKPECSPFPPLPHIRSLPHAHTPPASESDAAWGAPRLPADAREEAADDVGRHEAHDA
eukprot:6195408-Pleurochrysis_carterae.AAC.2